MKTNTFFFTAFIIALISFMSCNPKSSSVPEIESSKFESNLPSSCLFLENRRDGSQNQRINAICADTLIKNYQREIDMLKVQCNNFPNIDNLLNYGAKVDLASMYTIIEKIEDGHYDEIYAMSAAVPDEKSAIIFVLKNTSTNDRAFYNFTFPCPDACPDLIN